MNKLEIAAISTYVQRKRTQMGKKDKKDDEEHEQRKRSERKEKSKKSKRRFVMRLVNTVNGSGLDISVRDPYM